MNTKAVLPAITGFFFLALQSVFVKLISEHNIPTEWIVFVEFSTCLIIITCVAGYHKFQTLKTKKIKLHILRGVTGVMAFTCLVICIKKTNIVDGTLLFNTAPLFIPIVSMIWLKNKMDPKIWWGIIVGFIGIVLIIHPAAGDLLQMGELYGVASGILLAIAYVAMKELTRTESFEAILFYFSLTSVILSLPFVIMNWVNPPLIVWVYGILSGTSVMTYLFLLQRAYKFEEAAKLAPLTFSTVVYTVIFNWFLYNNIPDIYTIGGILLVSAGGIMSITLHGTKFPAKKHLWH